MRRVEVRAPGGTYPVWIGRGVLSELPRAIVRGRARASSVHLVADAKVHRHHGAAIESALAGLDLPLVRSRVPSGESSKSVEQLAKLWRRATKQGVDRDAVFVAFGGGVVGDLTGFAAASTLRGVAFVQVPTTLLAMVDASVGGKTGINLPEGKNLVGAFHQPRAVVMDLDLLRTLPERELRAGWAEVIKTAAIRDRALLGRLEARREELLAREPDALAEVVARCVRIKAKVVEEDERESGLRMILNFGHTLAHGIEAAQEYGELLHGEAVAVGMAFAARLAARLEVAPLALAERLEALLEAYGLPIRWKGGDASRILQAMGRDKKRGPGGLRWVFVPAAGRAEIHDDVSPALVRSELRRFLES